MNLNQVTLPVADLPEATAFYRRMGFVQIVSTAGYARFECTQGGATFSLVQRQGEFKNGATVYFEDENLDALVNDLVGRGFHFEQLPRDTRYLWREAILLDPSGNRIKLYHAGDNRRHPPWRVELRE